MPDLDWKGLIKKNELFRSLSDLEIEQLLDPDTSVEKLFAAGAEIIRHGERGRNFFLIGTGSVSISTPGPEGCDIDLAILEKGEFFGEMSLLRQQPRTATVRAREECAVLRVSAEKLRDLLKQRPDILASIFILLSERMRNLAERVINVSYHEVNHKLELFSTKLDAELKAMNSTLAATQAVFDQTTTRANEVISSTERHWNRMTLIGSVAAGILTLAVSGFAWVGLNKYSDFTKLADDAEKAIGKQVTSSEGLVSKLRESLDQKVEGIEQDIQGIRDAGKKATELTSKLNAQYLALQSGATFSVVPMLDKLAERDITSARYYIPILQKSSSLLLRSEQNEGVTVYFRELYSWVLADPAEASDENSRPMQIIRVLTNVLDSSEDMPPRNKALTYYFLLANLALVGSNYDFEVRLSELDKRKRSGESFVIHNDDAENFSPDGFIITLGDADEAGSPASKVRDKILAAWKKISEA